MSCAKLLVCDDHPPIRAAVTYIAKELQPDIVVLEAGSAVEALALLEVHPNIELMLLDLHMPGMNGLDFLPELKRRFSSLPVVVLSSDETRATVIDALERGATGYICKSSPTDLLAKFLEHALKGNITLPTSVVNTAKADPAQDAGFAPNASDRVGELGLSPQQTRVLACLLRGMSNKNIARELGLADGTIKTHTTAVFRALKVKSRAQAVIEAGRRGFPVGGSRS